MTAQSSRENQPIPLEIRAEAAAWIARLHGAERTQADEQSFRRWLTADEAHARAFERMTELWETAPRLKSDVLEHHRERRDTTRDEWSSRLLHAPKRLLAVAIATISVALAVIWAAFSLHSPILTTSVGERRNLTLEDGTRLTLNTATRVTVHYSETQRRVVLESGEAFFEVARSPNRPFIVATQQGDITALGTAFAVRIDAQKTEVTLVEGKVSVTSGQGAAQGLRSMLLAPGERVTLVAARPPAIDRPPVAKVTAWREGLIALDRTRLEDAVAEMNRYSAVKLVVEQPERADIEVSGLFHAGDSREFARALVLTHGVRASESGNTILLSTPSR